MPCVCAQAPCGLSPAVSITQSAAQNITTTPVNNNSPCKRPARWMSHPLNYAAMAFTYSHTWPHTHTHTRTHAHTHTHHGSGLNALSSLSPRASSLWTVYAGAVHHNQWEGKCNCNISSLCERAYYCCNIWNAVDTTGCLFCLFCQDHSCNTLQRGGSTLLKLLACRIYSMTYRRQIHNSNMTTGSTVPSPMGSIRYLCSVFRRNLEGTRYTYCLV